MNPTPWYDRDGQPITDMATIEHLLADPEYKRIGLTHITSTTNPNIDIKVSTVWLGLDHSFGDGPPIIFETMAFGDRIDGHQDRWHTKEGAATGHAECVNMIAANIPDAVIDNNYTWTKEITP